MFDHSRSKLLLVLGVGLGLTALQSCSSSISQSKPSAAIPASSINKTVLAEDKAIPRYEHIFVIIAENKSYEQIIGSPNAPNLNRFAKTYGLASQFYGEVHPSEANYSNPK